MEYTAAKGKLVRAYYFLEADRGTMPIQRQNLSKSSFYRKLLAYEATRTQNFRRTHLGLHRLQVLPATTPARVQTLVAACRGLRRGQGLFLFTDAKSLSANDSSLDLSWVSTRDHATESLLDCHSQPHSLP